MYLSPDVNDTMPEWINASNTASLNVSLLTDPRTCWGSAYSAIWLEPRMMKITIDDASCGVPDLKGMPPQDMGPGANARAAEHRERDRYRIFGDRFRRADEQ